MSVIGEIFGDSLKSSEYRRVHLFYSLFTAIFHVQFGLPNFSGERRALEPSDYARVLNSLSEIDLIFESAASGHSKLTSRQAQFLEDSRRATTDAPVRVRRTTFIVDLILAK